MVEEVVLTMESGQRVQKSSILQSEDAPINLLTLRKQIEAMAIVKLTIQHRFREEIRVCSALRRIQKALRLQTRADHMQSRITDFFQ